MRYRVPVATFVLLTSLACGGLGEDQDQDLPGPDEVPATSALAPLDASGEAPAIVVSGLTAEDGTCVWKALRFPGGEEVGALAQIAGDCPEVWVGTASGDHALLLSAAGGVLRLGAVTTELPAPPVAPEAVGLDGDVPVVCARIEATLVEDDGETPRHFQVGGDAVEAETEDAVGRSWRLVDGAWVEKTFTPVHTHGVAYPCAAVPGFPDGPVQSAPAVQVELDASGSEGADAAQLEKLDPISWGVASGGWIAVHREAVEGGSLDGPPVAWRVSGGDWALVEGTEGAVVEARGPWLFVSTAERSRLLDARTGEEAWSTAGWGAVVADDVSVPAPSAASEEPAPATVASPTSEPAKPTTPAPSAAPKAGGAAGGRAKVPAGMHPGTKAKVKRVQPVPH